MFGSGLPWDKLMHQLLYILVRNPKCPNHELFSSSSLEKNHKNPTLCGLGFHVSTTNLIQEALETNTQHLGRSWIVFQSKLRSSLGLPLSPHLWGTPYQARLTSRHPDTAKRKTSLSCLALSAVHWQPPKHSPLWGWIFHIASQLLSVCLSRKLLYLHKTSFKRTGQTWQRSLPYIGS